MRKAILLFLMLTLACETKEHVAAETGAIKKAQHAAASAAAHATGTASEEDFGIPDCDDYIQKYEACLTRKVPANEQTRLRSILDDQKKRWRAAATNEFERPGLADQCRSAAVAAKQSLGSFGCDF